MDQTQMFTHRGPRIGMSLGRVCSVTGASRQTPTSLQPPRGYLTTDPQLLTSASPVELVKSWPPSSEG